VLGTREVYPDWRSARTSNSVSRRAPAAADRTDGSRGRRQLPGHDKETKLPRYARHRTKRRFVARYGGDEFVIAVPETGEVGAIAFARDSATRSRRTIRHR